MRFRLASVMVDAPAQAANFTTPQNRQGYRIWSFFLSSFPRKRKSMAAANAVEGWIPAFAGMTEVRNRRLLRHMRSPCPKPGELLGDDVGLLLEHPVAALRDNAAIGLLGDCLRAVE